ncbi:DUF1080 domain-containing protein [bacterium]|nr:DUF1080 domain-containing protein [bacterium]
MSRPDTFTKILTLTLLITFLTLPSPAQVMDETNDSYFVATQLSPRSNTTHTPKNTAVLSDERVLFEDSFENGLVPEWDLEEGWQWKEEARNSYLIGTGHSFAKLNLENDWTDYEIHLNFMIVNEGFHLIFRLNQEGRYFVSVDEGEVTLNKQFFPNRFLPVLAQSQVIVDKGIWHTMSVQVVDNRIRVALNGEELIDHTDEDTPFRQGSFSLETVWDAESRIYFDDLSIKSSLPIPIPGDPDLGIFDENRDIYANFDSLGAEGKANYDEGTNTYFVEGSGEDVWNQADAFHFVYKEWYGDFDLMADVLIEGGLPEQLWIKGMLLARNTLAPGSVHVGTRVRRDGQYSLQWRIEENGECNSTLDDGSRILNQNPGRHRLERVGDTFNCYYLNDGEWILVDSVEVFMEDPIYVGLGVTSHDVAEIATGTFHNVNFKGDGPPPTLKPTPTEIIQPTIHPSPTLKPIVVNPGLINRYTLLSDSEYQRIPGGFDNADIGSIYHGSIISKPNAAPDGVGVAISVPPGAVELLLFNPLEVAEDRSLLEALVHSSEKEATLALGALDGSKDGTMDGSIALDMPAHSENFIDSYQKMFVLYDAPGDGLVYPIFQVKNQSEDKDITIYLDEIKVYAITGNTDIPSSILQDNPLVLPINRTEQEIALPMKFLTLLIWPLDSPGDQKVNEILDEFTDKTGIAVSRIRAEDPRHYVNELRNRCNAASDILPDLIMVQPDVVIPLVRSEHIISLNNLADEFNTDFSNPFYNPYFVGDRLFAIPLIDRANETTALSITTNAARENRTQGALALIDFLRDRMKSVDFLSKDIDVDDLYAQPPAIRKGTTKAADLTSSHFDYIWDLGDNTRLEPGRTNAILYVSENGEATWKEAYGRNYQLKFTFLPVDGKAEVVLQRSQMNGQISEYRFVFGNGVASLVRQAGSDIEILGERDLHLSPDIWHKTKMICQEGHFYIGVDNKKIFSLNDPNPLAPGEIVFKSNNQMNVGYSGIKFTRLDTDSATKLIQDSLQNDLNNEIPVFENPILKDPEQYVVPDSVVPLIAKIINHATPDKLQPIQCQLIPPNFVHTWVIDLKDIDTFKFDFGDKFDNNLEPDDRITIHTIDTLIKSRDIHYTSDKGTYKDVEQPIAVIHGDTTGETIDISTVKAFTSPPFHGFKRIFLTLETSTQKPASIPKRKFTVRGVIDLGNISGNEEAVLYGNNLNYNDASISHDLDDNSHLMTLSNPWDNPNEIDWPDPAEGWYLVGKHIYDPNRLFNMLVFYNEQTSFLRLYLHNKDFSAPEVTGFMADIWLEGYNMFNADGYQPLTGAIFPIHLNPNKWGRISIPLGKWDHDSWKQVDLPILYPMTDYLEMDIDWYYAHKFDGHYRCLYEDRLKNGYRNTRLKVHINSYEKMSTELGLVGEMIGGAKEILSGKDVNGFESFLQKYKSKQESIEGAENLYSALVKSLNKMKSKYNNSDESKKFDVEELIKAVGEVSTRALAEDWVGAGAMGVKYISSFFVGPEEEDPMQMMIELAFAGKAKGVSWQENNGDTCWVYLPGRFSVSDAIVKRTDMDGLTSEFDVNDPFSVRYFPIYDRTIGHFGYKYHPQNVICPLTRIDKGSQSPRFLYPPIPNFDPETGRPIDPQTGEPVPEWETYRPGWEKWRIISSLLPIIYNPYSEIIPMQPREYSDNVYIHDIAWDSHKDYINPEANDYTFPSAKKEFWNWIDGPEFRFEIYRRSQKPHTPAGYGRLTPCEQCVPSTYLNFKQISDINIFPLSPLPGYGNESIDTDRLIPTDSLASYSLQANAEYQGTRVINDVEYAEYFIPYDPYSPFPIYNIFYKSKYGYFYYGRSRTTESDPAVPRYRGIMEFYAPVSMEITRYNRSDNMKKEITIHKSKILNSQE